MSNYYSSNPKLYVGIDCIIFGFNEGELNLLLLKRNFEPAMGEWSLMGGFVQEDESVDDAAKRVLNELTGLEDVYMEQVQAFGAIDRDPGERVVSIVYYALININEYDKESVQQHNAFWVNINELPALIFDHPQMVEKARKLMQHTTSTSCCSTGSALRTSPRFSPTAAALLTLHCSDVCWCGHWSGPSSPPS